MKTLALGLGCAAVLTFASFMSYQGGAATAKAQDSAATQDGQDKKKDGREAKVRDLMRQTGAADLGKELMDQMMDNFQKMGAALPAGFAAKFKELAKPDDLVNMVVPIYIKHVDEETLDGAMKFFKSPIGQRWVAAQKKIMRESQAAGQAWGRQLGMRVMQELRK